MSCMWNNVMYVIQWHACDTMACMWYNVTHMIQCHVCDTKSCKWYNVMHVIQCHVCDTISCSDTMSCKDKAMSSCMSIGFHLLLLPFFVSYWSICSQPTDTVLLLTCSWLFWAADTGSCITISYDHQSQIRSLISIMPSSHTIQIFISIMICSHTVQIFIPIMPCSHTVQIFISLPSPCHCFHQICQLSLGFQV